MKTVLVTGAGRGLGKGFVEYFLDQGFVVFAGVRVSSDDSNGLKKRENLRVLPLDVTSDDSISGAAEFISAETDHLDYLVNNAGVNKDTVTNNHKELVCNLADLDRKLLLEMFDINTVSPMIVLQKCLDLLKGDPSFVVNISSNRASFGDDTNTSGNYGYRASKAALNMMTLSSLFDLPKNIKTFAVHPGDVKTDMNPEGDQDAKKQAGKIIAITLNWKEEFNGKFLKYSGEFYPS